MNGKLNFVLIVVDALRACNMQLYDYELRTTPILNSYLDRMVVFKNAYCTATNTDPSLTAIFSGKYPVETGIFNHGSKVTRSEFIRAQRLKYFTEIIHNSGNYWTGAIDVSDRWHRKGFVDYIYQTKSNFYGLGSVANNLLDNLHAYEIFFAILTHIVSPSSLPPSNLKAETITDNAMRLVRDKWKNPAQGNFLFIHYWDTHAPYSPPEDLTDNFLVPRDLGELEGHTPSDIVRSFRHPLLKPIDCAWLKKAPDLEHVLAAYDGAVAHVDQEIGRFLEEISKMGYFDRTLIIVTSDHGESLLEHGIYFDHHGLYEQVAKVPLLMILPDRILPEVANKRISASVSHVDLVPTILDLAEFSYSSISGKSMVPLILNRKTQDLPSDDAAVRPILIEESHFERKRAVRIGRFKLIKSLTGEKCKFCGREHGVPEELFDLHLDPGETTNLAGERSDLIRSMKSILFETVGRNPSGDCVLKASGELHRSTGANRS